METLYYYRCDGCQVIHANSDNIFKCKICGEEICTSCANDEKTCFDYCEPNVGLIKKDGE